MTPEEAHQRNLLMFAQFVLRLLLEEKEWDDSVQELIEDSAMDLGLIETDRKGDYKLTQAN